MVNSVLTIACFFLFNLCLTVRVHSYDEFLFAVSGELNERRSQVILEAFEVMDKDKSGAVNAADLKVRQRRRRNSRLLPSPAGWCPPALL